MDVIKFYKVSDPFGFLSNFSRHPIWIDGQWWSSAEHFFQSEKFESIEAKNAIRNCEKPIEAAKLGRSREFPLRAEWEEIKEDVMQRALFAKFSQHPNLFTDLLKTNDATLIEHTTNDSYWGDGGGGGKNRLGHLLMDIRAQLVSLTANTGIPLPPWLAFPGISGYDGFWRMGKGEEYIDNWVDYYLKSNMKSIYKEIFLPPQDGWAQYYEGL